MLIPLVVLAVPAALIGFLETPRTLLDLRLFSQFVAPALPGEIPETASQATEALLQGLSEAASLLGILLAWLLSRSQLRAEAPAGREPRRPAALGRFLSSGWGFDRLYNLLLVRPLTWAAEANRSDLADIVARGPAALAARCSRLLSRTQNGKLRWYVGGLGLGAVILVAMAVFL